MKSALLMLHHENRVEAAYAASFFVLMKGIFEQMSVFNGSRTGREINYSCLNVHQLNCVNFDFMI